MAALSALTDKVAVVTGAAGGIGSAIVRALHEQGAAVAAWDLDGAKIKATVEGLPSTLPVEVDITSRESVEAAQAATRDRLGPVDILVNNAGIDKIERFLDSEEATWERIVAVNFLGTIRCCHV